MSAAQWGAIAFGSTLALVVGLRLSQSGLMVVGTLMIVGALLFGRWMMHYLRENVPEVFVERQGRGGLHRSEQGRAALPWPIYAPRRGGWPHLSEALKRSQQ